MKKSLILMAILLLGGCDECSIKKRGSDIPKGYITLSSGTHYTRSVEEMGIDEMQKDLTALKELLKYQPSLNTSGLCICGSAGWCNTCGTTPPSITVDGKKISIEETLATRQVKTEVLKTTKK